MTRGNNRGRATQAELASLFERSQTWVSNMQRRLVDPMPRDLEGARAWGIRTERLADPASGETPSPALVASPAPEAPALPVEGTLDKADLDLKVARAERLRIELERLTGEVIPREEAERLRIAAAAEFRRIATSFPVRVLALAARHITEPEALAAFEAGLAPVAAELLNGADPLHLLLDRTKEELRAILRAHVEALLEARPDL